MAYSDVVLVHTGTAAPPSSSDSSSPQMTSQTCLQTWTSSWTPSGHTCLGLFEGERYGFCVFKLCFSTMVMFSSENTVLIAFFLFACNHDVLIKFGSVTKKTWPFYYLFSRNPDFPCDFANKNSFRKCLKKNRPTGRTVKKRATILGRYVAHLQGER